MKVEYCVVKEKYVIGEKEQLSFGIAAVEAYGDAYSVIASVHNCCKEIHIMSNLVEKCNRLDLSPMHLEDVVNDLLSEV